MKQRLRGLIRPVPAACATADAGRGEKRLLSEKNQAISTSVGRPLGECRLRILVESGMLLSTIAAKALEMGLLEDDDPYDCRE